ncbi:MAG: copper amine oxidase N-terminal domain-containing protein, partial [Defluviitaleaceae bacterium]|nr:copper amine oxidase N-terminal domain-containing protein [Defluviitaleaceae bacterium]
VAVKRAGVTSVIGAGILPIQKDGSVLVPLRVVMGCFGISVSWDEYANTAVLIDIPKLAADIDSHCTILNTILNASKDTAVYRQKGSGSVDLSVDDGTGGTPVHAGFTMDGITDGTAASGNMTLNLDLKSLLSDSALSSGEVDAAAQAEIQQIMDMFSNISIDYIYNPDDQTIYVKSGLLDGLLTMMGMDAAPGAWYELDLSGLLGADMTGSLLSMLGMDDTGMSSLTVGGLIALTYDYSDSYTVGDYADLQSSLPMIYALIGDQAFTTTNNADGSVTYGYSLSDKMITDLLTQSMLANQDAIDSARAEMEYQNETTDQYNALMIQYTEECGIPYDDSYALPLQTIPEDNAALVAAYIAETYQLPAFNISLSLTYKDNVMTAVNANVSMQMNSDFEKLSLTVMVSSATPGQTVITLNLTDNYDYGDGYTTGTSLKINVNYTTTVSDEPVATAPPDGAVVVDLDSLMY